MKEISEEKIRVLIDLDGVLRNYVEGVIRVYRREYPQHRILPVTSRRLEDFFPIGEKIYPFIGKKFYREVLEEAPPYPGAIESMHARQRDFEMVLVTAQPPHWRYSTFIWIGKHRVPVNDILIRREKHKETGVALLDDFVENLEAFADTGRLAVCMDQPWNQEWPGPRAGTVDEFFDIVLEYLGSRPDEKVNFT